MTLKALFLNCTLKSPGETSNTRAYIKNAEKIFHKLGVQTEVLRMSAYNIKYGNSSDEGENDEWPRIVKKIYDADILIIATPIWRGDRSSISKLIAERMDGIWEDTNEDNGQYFTYNKVAGVMVDGNEDGAKKSIANILFDLNEQGFTIPVNAFTYYVGKAGPGKSYIDDEGDKHEFTNNYILIMVHNLVQMAKILKETPYVTNLNKLKLQAKEMSR